MLGNTGGGIRGWSNFSFGSGHSNTVRPIPDVAKNFRGHKLPMSTEWLGYECFSDDKLAFKASSSRKPNLHKTNRVVSNGNPTDDSHRIQTIDVVSDAVVACLILFVTLIEPLALIRPRWNPYRHHRN